MSNIVKINAKWDHTCRLCLKPATKQFREVDEIIKQIFDVLLLKLDLSITRNPIVCQDCIVIVDRCLIFKWTCIGTEKIIQSLSISREDATHDIKIIYKEIEHLVTVSDEDLDVCRFCFTRLVTNNFVQLYMSTNKTVLEMLSEYMPEMDFNTIENPMICTNCRENIEGYFKFTVNCFDVEEKMKAYHKKGGTKKMGLIKLDTPKLLEYPERSAQMSVVKDELNTFENREYTDSGPNSELMKVEEEVDIKAGVNLEVISGKNLAEVELDICPKEFDKEMKLAMPVHKNESQKKMYNCSLCPYEGTKKRYLVRHMITHKDVSEINLHKCSLCSYRAKQKYLLNRHMLIHRDLSKIKMYKCSLCTYEGTQQRFLKKHMSTHQDVTKTETKDISEIKLYKCLLCPYEGKQKRRLRSHMLVHKDISEIKMYKCTLCAYEAKRKNLLNNHILTHKDITEIKTYKCSVCAYEGKQKSYLKKHMLTHKDVTKIKMYKCSMCAYEAKRKLYLIRHMLIHQDITEIKMYKCSLCAYEAKRRRTLNVHMLVHKDVSEIKTYKCLSCGYEARQKCNLNKHMLLHKDVSEIEMHKCTLCAYETKRKQNLKKHMLTHRDLVSEKVVALCVQK